MRLYLASQGLPDDLRDTFLALLGADRRLAYIENAKDPEPPEWRKNSDTRRQMAEAGIMLTDVDLRDFYDQPEALCEKLKSYPGVWIAGGNTYYLRYAMQASWFDRIIAGLVENGMLYGGASAGAIVAGPTLRGYGSVDDPEAAPVLIENGLGLTRICILPHWESEYYGNQLKETYDQLTNDGRTIVTLNDNQALVINGKHIQKYGPDHRA